MLRRIAPWAQHFVAKPQALVVQTLVARTFAVKAAGASAGATSSIVKPSVAAAALDNSSDEEDVAGEEDDDDTVIVARLGNPYYPKVAYRTDYVTSQANPLHHTFGHVGRYFSLGTEAETRALFPGGLAGQLENEFSTTGTQSVLIRPTGVMLAQHLEHWRQTHGRDLAKQGHKVLDISSEAAYAPAPLDLPTATDAGHAAMLSLGGPTSRVERAELAARAKAATPAGEAIAPRNPLDPRTAPFRPFRILTGPIGVGKSAVLNYLNVYARKNQWLTLFVPNAWDIMKNSLVLIPSKHRPGFVDQHDMALKLLKTTLEGQEELLSRVPQKGVYAAFRYLPRSMDAAATRERERQRVGEEEEKRRLTAEAVAKGKAWDANTYKSKVDDESNTSVDRSTFTLKDMLQWGIAHPTAATDTLLHFISELKQVTAFPVMLAVDGLNLLYEPTNYPIAGRLLAAEELSIPSALHCLGAEGFRDEFAMKRGVVLATITQRHAKPMRMFEVANVRSKYKVRVPELTRPEIHSTLLHYHHSSNFMMVTRRESVDAFAVEYYRTLCNGIPSQIFNAAMFQPD